jgi:hypothetical protein
VKLKAECEAWLHFLNTRTIVHPRVDRLWFAPEKFITDQNKIIVETTKNRIDRVFEDWIREQFMLYRLPVLRYSLKNLTEIFNDPKNSKYKIDATELKAFLKEKLKMEIPDKVSHYSFPIGYKSLDDPRFGDPMIDFKKDVGRPMNFNAEQWVTPEQRATWTTSFGEDLTSNEVKELSHQAEARRNQEIYLQAQAEKQKQQEKTGVQISISDTEDDTPEWARPENGDNP